MDPKMQPLQCKVCQQVTLADGSSVWVCKECGNEHQPGEAVVVDTDTALQADVNDAAKAVQPPAAASSTPPAVDPTKQS